ncbi:MAG TPA: tRNA (adenosine(37)-N6)-dimethylallyltransferase MiaA [Chitinophagaceae bacterium]|nr:tRNA (adenosine(37)-N6)-dimethylallyltransferase MiaA [Chitinophagaceae bacterium]
MTCFIILGPTAVGKTSVAISLAQHFQTDIISADSRQCFRELNIGVAKPSPEELAAVKHYFINSHSIHDEMNAAIFERLALQWTHEIFHTKDTAIMAGGTGLYIRAFAEGMDDIPSIPDHIRDSIQASYDQHGIAWLQGSLRTLDPAFYETGEINNPQRMMRALEIVIGTGRSILSYRGGTQKERPFRIIKIGLDIPREQLYQQINERVDKMMQQGLADEAAGLFPMRTLNALQTVGYTELFEHMEGKTTLAETVQLIKQHTRNYAKRQLTWFRRDPSVTWFAPSDTGSIIQFCEEQD